MIQFKSIAMPAPSVGAAGGRKKITVPNQSMSLEEILARFTRGESLEIGKEPQYHESDDDLEKISRGDLVDRMEFSEKLKQTQKNYDKQEKAKAKAERQRLEKMAVDKIEADKKAAE